MSPHHDLSRPNHLTGFGRAGDESQSERLDDISERALRTNAQDRTGEIVVNPLRTLLYELFVEPILQLWRRIVVLVS